MNISIYDAFLFSVSRKAFAKAKENKKEDSNSKEAYYRSRCFLLEEAYEHILSRISNDVEVDESIRTEMRKIVESYV